MPAIRRRWTAADVRALMDESRAWPRYELIDGELLVTPAPGSVHQIVVGELFLLIAPYIEREQLGLTFLSPADLELRKETISQPDLFVVPTRPGRRDEALRWSDVSELLLAVEVISRSSARTDRVTKRDHYMEAKVGEYWVVDVESRLIERWAPRRETPLVTRTMLTWHPEVAQHPFVLELAAFFDRARDKSRSIPR